MKLNNIKLETLKLVKEDHFDYFEDEYYANSGSDDYGDDGEEADEDEEDHLCYLIRTFLNGNRITSSVERSELDISVYVFLQKKEKFKNIVRTFDVVINKMKKDILPQYELEVELYESKDGIPILSFSFFFVDGDKDDKAPF
jgi:hypothetical protein